MDTIVVPIDIDDGSENESNAKHIDCHCHLQDYSNEELVKIIESCGRRGIIALLTNSTSMADFDRTLDLATKNLSQTIQIIPGFGYHPWHLHYATENNTWFDEFTSFLNKIPSSIKYFIGEIGIDGGKIKKTFPLDIQIEIFTKQLQFANESNLLVHIHCVYEWDKLFKIMKGINLETLIKNGKIILHSFQGKPKHIDKFNSMNVWYSLSSGCYSDGNIEMIKLIPVNRLIYESDSPSMFNSKVYPTDYDYKDFCVDKEHGSKKNSPISLIALNSKLSEIKNIKPDELSKIVLGNSKKIIQSILT